MADNENLFMVLEPRSYVYKFGHSHSARIRRQGGREYYTMLRRCHVNLEHRPEQIKVYLDEIPAGEDVRSAFKKTSKHCMECGVDPFQVNPPQGR